jgi:hypothetical protein
MLDVRNASSALRRSSSDSVASFASLTSRRRFRVTPRRQPASGGGVRATPSCTTNTFVPVPSHSSSRVLAKMPSSPPCSAAKATQRTFSAYETVLRPAHAPRSLRTHGTMTTSAGPVGSSRSVATTNAVGEASPRIDPGGATPPVTVTRTRASRRRFASSTASAASRNVLASGTARPRPSAEWRRRSWCRCQANGTPS